MFEIQKDRFYIVRCARAGVFFGRIAEVDEKAIKMQDVRKLWYWDGAAAVEQLAVEGTSKPDECKFTVTIPEMVIAEPIQIIACSDKAAEIIRAVKEWRA